MMLKLAILSVLTASAPSWAAPRHEVADKDHLWGLAGKYYGNNHCWRAIYEANKGSIKDPHWIYPGQALALPDSPTCGKAPAPEARAQATEASAPAAAGFPVEASAPAPEAQAPAAQEPAPELVRAAPASAVQTPASAAPLEPLARETEEGFMKTWPKGQVSFALSSPRVEFPIGWKGDGVVTSEGLAEKDGEFTAKMKLRSFPIGARFTAYRQAAPLESDGDKKAVFLVKVGSAQAVKQVKEATYGFKALKVVEPITLGDLLKLDR